MRIYHFENPADLEVLRAKNEEVPAGIDLRAIVQEMIHLMREAKGVGLAAPQVGINQRFFITEIEKGKVEVFINPIITFTSVDLSTYEEGCLSLAGLYVNVERPAKIRMQTTTLEGKTVTLEAEGFPAVVLQHEYDHLEGKVFIDRLNEAKLEGVLKQYNKIVKKRSKG